MIMQSVMNLVRSRTARVLAVGAAAVSTVGFCILTSSSGYFRRYLDNDIPFVYQINSSVPPDYIDAIERGANKWNTVESAYWEFQRGPDTDINAAGQDGVSLLLFDVAGDNFEPGTSTIAFSRTFTTGSGPDYHATESDLVWNARDFPPSPTGQPGRQDLQSVITHEFGHHLGLGHQGTPGSPPGCGPDNTAAVMYGLSSAGDTSKRQLHLEDIAGVSTVYPTWVVTGSVTDAAGGLPVENARIRYLGGNVTAVGSVESPLSGRYERPGLVLQEDYSGVDGIYANVALNDSLVVVVDAFGAAPDTAIITFGPPGGIGQTEVLVNDVALQFYPEVAVTGSVKDGMTQAPVTASVELTGLNEYAHYATSTTTDAAGDFAVTVPSGEAYRVVVRAVAPYPDEVMVDSVFVPPTGQSVDLGLAEAEVLLVDDDDGSAYQQPYQESLDRLSVLRRTFSIADSTALPGAVLATFSSAPVLLWMTGDDTTDAITPAERTVVLDHLTGGGSVILAGQNILEYADSADPLLEQTLGLRWTANAPSLLVVGFAGDPIGNGVSYSFSGGAGNQTSKDRFVIVPGSVGTPTKTLYHKYLGSDTTMLAGARIVGPGAAWTAVFFGFGLEGMMGDRIDTLLTRSLRYFQQTVTGIVPSGTAGTPLSFELAQNYPNPFNPSTTIQFSLPVRAAVTITVFDLSGRVVRSLLKQEQEAGMHTAVWDARDDRGQHVSSGVYFYRLEASGPEGILMRQTRKMVLVQ